MKIADIKHRVTKETRTDGRYPLRIGSEVEFYRRPCEGECMLLLYITDNKGNPKDGILRTSTVQSIERSVSGIAVTTRNSIYCFELANTTEERGAVYGNI